MCTFINRFYGITNKKFLCWRAFGGLRRPQDALHTHFFLKSGLHWSILFASWDTFLVCKPHGGGAKTKKKCSEGLGRPNFCESWAQICVYKRESGPDLRPRCPQGPDFSKSGPSRPTPRNGGPEPLAGAIFLADPARPLEKSIGNDRNPVLPGGSLAPPWERPPGALSQKPPFSGGPERFQGPVER